MEPCEGIEDAAPIRFDRVPALRRPLKPLTPRAKDPVAPELLATVSSGDVVQPDIFAAVGSKVVIEPVGRPLFAAPGPVRRQQWVGEPPRSAASATPATASPRQAATPATASRTSTPRQAKNPKPAQEDGWGEKYRFFSGGHMRRSYTNYARARSDPFNKDPSWGKSVLSRVAVACTKQQIEPRTLFDSMNVTGGAHLNRAEVRRCLTSVVPDLSDMELAALFDVIDENGNGEVSVDEFCHAMEAVRSASKIDKSTANRWRNPIHRIGRVAPAMIEGWDHLAEEPPKVKGLDNLCTVQMSEMQHRLSGILPSPRTARTLQDPGLASKYVNFNGGGYSARFRRIDHKRKLNSFDEPLDSTRLPDPGPELRPGWLCDPAGRQLLKSFGLT